MSTPNSADAEVAKTAQTEPSARVLLVEDDRGLRESLATVLAFQGLDIYQAENAEEGRLLLADHDPALLLLDVNLPGADGLELLRELREHGDDRQVLLLTALHEIEDRVAGLDAGADDYLAKPFALEELLARVRVMLRRANISTDTAIGEARRLGEVTVEPAARRVTVGDVELDLTKRQYDVLALLFARPDHVLNRALIHDKVWGYEEDLGSNTLEVVISTLRRKLEINGAARVIHTVRGVGYVARLVNDERGRPS